MGNKDFNLDNVLEIVNDLENQYHLPEVVITNGEWQALLDNLSDCFKNSDNNDLEVSTNIIIRRAFHEALIDHCDKISFYYVIIALRDLVAFSIYENKQTELKNKIMFDALKNNISKEKNKTK